MVLFLKSYIHTFMHIQVWEKQALVLSFETEQVHATNDWLKDKWGRAISRNSLAKIFGKRETREKNLADR
jgi:hypothetical protein